MIYLLFIVPFLPLVSSSTQHSLLHQDLGGSFEIGTLITVFFKVNKQACPVDAAGEECRTYIDLRTDTSGARDNSLDVPAIVQVFDSESYGVRTGSQTGTSRTFAPALSIPLGRKPSAFDMWAVDILKVSSTELRIFFQNTGGVLAHTLRSTDDVKSIHLFTDEWTPAAGDPSPQIQIHRPNNLILTENQQEILTRFDATIRDKESNRKVADLASFPVGSHLHLVTFANKALFVDETDGRKSVFGLRGKAQSAGEVPFSVEYRWGNADASEPGQGEHKKLCFDDSVRNELAHMDIWRLNATAILMELHYMRAPGASAAHCLSCIYNHPSYATELDQPLEIFEAQGAIVLHAQFMPADSTQYPMNPDRC